MSTSFGPGYPGTQAQEGYPGATSAYPSHYPSHLGTQPQAVQLNAWPMPKKRNVGMIIGGVVLLVIGLGFGALFLMNLRTYLTADETFGEGSRQFRGMGTKWVVDLIKEASLRRMTIFGPISGLLSIGGAVLGGLGLRKK